MRKNITNTKGTTLKKTICMAAMMTAILSLTACGGKETPEDKLKNELSSALEDMNNATNDSSNSSDAQQEVAYYTFENGVLTVNAESYMKSIVAVLRNDGINKDEVVEVIITGNVTTAQGCSSFSNLKKVTIGESVTTIYQDAFKNCDKLETVIMADNVTSIGESAFWSCDVLTTVKLSANLEKIGRHAFHDCISLTTMNIPASTKYIQDQAFESCKSLTSITLAEGLESIGNAAFAGVPAAEINIPSTVKYIGDYAISSCPNITSVVFPQGVEQLSKGVVAGCPSLISVTIPDSVTFIYENPIGEDVEVTIYGKAGSLAEKFASDYGFTFVAQ